MEYTFGLRGHDIADGFQQMCSVARDNNVKELQFAMAKTINDINFNDFGYNTDFSAKIKNQLNEYGLSVDVLGCYINPVNADRKELDKALKLFGDFIPYARDFNATVIGTETGSNGDLKNTWSEENYKFFLDNFCPLVQKAEDYGVTIGIEPLRFFTISSPTKMKRMIDDVKSENLGVILDISNMIEIENRKDQHLIIDQSFDLFADKIKVIHLKDFMFDKNEKKITLVGAGELDVKYLFDKIKTFNVSCQFILDETRVEDYSESLIRIENLLSENN